MIFVNFKTYSQSSGERAVSLAGLILEVSREVNLQIISCPQAVDLREVAKLGGSVWAQHADGEVRGRATGWIPAEVVREAGATGVLLNHSEHKLTMETLAAAHLRCKQVGLTTLVFAANLEEAQAVAGLRPDFLAYEPPELIASKDTSVARSKPEVIEDVVKAVPDIPILVGAGVKDAQDVRVSLERGAKGVGLASAVILSEDPRKVLEDLVQGFK